MNINLLGAQNNTWHAVRAMQMFVLKTCIFIDMPAASKKFFENSLVT